MLEPVLEQGIPSGFHAGVFWVAESHLEVTRNASGTGRVRDAGAGAAAGGGRRDGLERAGGMTTEKSPAFAGVRGRAQK